MGDEENDVASDQDTNQDADRCKEEVAMAIDESDAEIVSVQGSCAELMCQEYRDAGHSEDRYTTLVILGVRAFSCVYCAWWMAGFKLEILISFWVKYHASSLVNRAAVYPSKGLRGSRSRTESFSLVVQFEPVLKGTDSGTPGTSL